MSRDAKPPLSVGPLLLASIPAAATIFAAVAWLMLSLFATAMGSKAPTLSEMLAIVWPSLAGSLLAAIAIFLLARRRWLVSILVSGAGLAAVVLGARSIFS